MMSLTTSRADAFIGCVTRPIAVGLVMGATLVAAQSLSASSLVENDGAIVLRQTPLGPMPTDPRELSVSADASHVMLLSSAGTRHIVYIDGNEGQPYSSVQIASAPGEGDATTRAKPAMLMISPDKTRFAYMASKGPNNWMMVLNGKEGPAFERIPIAAFGPVGHRFAYVGNKAGKSYIVVDGTISSAYQQMLAIEMQFSPDGQHIAYAAQTEGAGGGNTWHAVIDGKEQPGYLQVEQLKFSTSGGHLAYIARTGNGQEFCAVVDGQAGPKFQLIQSLTFNDDGTHFAYAGCKVPDPNARGAAPKWVAVIDGQAGPEFDQITGITLSPDGMHSAYAGTEGAGTSRSAMYAVVNGKKSLDYTHCGNFLYSPDSQHLAYVAMNNAKNVVVFDGKEHTAHDQVDQQSLQFTADSKRFGYLAGDSDGWRAVIDGKVGAPRQAIENRSLAFTADGQHHRFLTRNSSEWFVIVDDAPTPAPGQPVICEMVTSADGKHVGTATIKNPDGAKQEMQFALDGQPSGPICRTIAQLQLSADGAHYACIGAIPNDNGVEATHVLHDGRAGPGFMRVDKVTLSPDGQHVAYAGYTPEGKKTIIVDDFIGPTFDEIIVITGDCPQAIQFRADGSLDFLAVLDQKLSRYVMTSESIGALPRPAGSIAPSAGGTATAAVAPGYAKMYEFGQAKDDGAKPAAITAGLDGTIYGATTAGGEFQKGVLFSIKPDGSGYKILHSFEGGRGDGAYPNSLRVAPDGTLCGSLQVEGASGHGAVFHCAADGSNYTIIHPFTGNKDGASPMIYAVDADGTIYGTSNRNRTPLHLFRMKPGSEFTIVYDAPQVVGGINDTGIGPFVDGGDGFFYGVADLNIFKVKKDGTGYAVVRTFNGPPRDINMADRAPILGSDGLLYGFASTGGKTTGGVVYKIARDGSGYSMCFDPSDAPLSPRAMAEGPDGKLYLLADRGIVRVNRDGSDFTVLQELAGGFFPLSAVVHDGVFYSATAQGAKGGFIFRYGIGGTGAVAAAPAAPTVTFQIVLPTPIDSNVEIPVASQ